MDIEDADRLTTLLHINTELNILLGSSISFATVLARLLPSSARLRIFILLTVVRAVSAEEKNDESISNTAIIIIVATSLGSIV